MLSSFPGTSSSPFKNLSGAGLLTFHEAQLPGEQVTPLCSALPHPSAIPQ